MIKTNQEDRLVWLIFGTGGQKFICIRDKEAPGKSHFEDGKKHSDFDIVTEVPNIIN